MIIYKITNKINGKIYIGQTIRAIKKRFKQHIRESSSGRGNALLNKTIRKYGKENFTIEEIGGANSQSELNYLEWLYVHNFNSLVPNGLNMKEGGGARGNL